MSQLYIVASDILYLLVILNKSDLQPIPLQQPI